ncbi:MAG: allantoinase AllB [Bradymonadaceae bacterium]
MTRRAFISARGVALPEGIRPAAIVVHGGEVEAVCEPSEVPYGIEVIDVGDRVILPGVIDPHVHINEPGRTDWEGFETATRAAARGGITLLTDMPLNSAPVTTSTDALAQKLEAARGKLHVDCAFHGGLVPGNEGAVAELIDAGVVGIKAFLCHSGIDDFPNATERELRAAMPVLARRNIPLLVHAELVHDVGPVAADPQSYRGWMDSRPASFELRAIELLIELCREYDAAVHIVHLATAEALPLLEQARAEGLPITVETAQHYLYFAAEDIHDGATLFKCAPPIRGRDNREGLWKGLRAGIIDLIATDHSPAPPELKGTATGDFTRAWGGISSLELSLPIVWTAARARGFSLEDVVQWVSTRPAQLLGLQESMGTIEPGKEANLVVFDEDRSFVVDASRLQHRHKLSPYHGQTLTGGVDGTYLRGERIDDLRALTGKTRLSTGK